MISIFLKNVSLWDQILESNAESSCAQIIQMCKDSNNFSVRNVHTFHCIQWYKSTHCKSEVWTSFNSNIFYTNERNVLVATVTCCAQIKTRKKNKIYIYLNVDQTNSLIRTAVGLCLGLCSVSLKKWAWAIKLMNFNHVHACIFSRINMFSLSNG